MRALRAALLAAVAVFAAVPLANAADLGGAPTRRNSIKDEPPPTYVPASVFSWSGFYIGAHLGYGWSDVDWENVSNSLGGKGTLLGGQIGYNWQRGAIVFGVEGDSSASWVDGGSGCCGHSVDWVASMRGRLGVTMFDNRTLLYGTGGVAWANIDYSDDTFTGDSKTHFGYVVGGGIEHMLTQRLSARVEYLYYDFKDYTASAGALGAGPTTVDPSMQTVRFGLNLKF